MQVDRVRGHVEMRGVFVAYPTFDRFDPIISTEALKDPGKACIISCGKSSSPGRTFLTVFGMDVCYVVPIGGASFRIEW